MHVTDSILRDRLKANFGEIEEFFLFKDSPYDFTSFGERSNPKKTYSVMLRHPLPVPATNCLDVEVLIGVYVQVERFSFKMKVERDSNLQVLPTPKSPLYSKTSFQGVPTMDYPESTQLQRRYDESPTISRHYRSSSSVTTLRLQSESSRVTDRYPRRAASLDRKNMFLNGYSRQEFTEELQNHSHHIKPTSRLYRSLRGEDPQFLGIFLLKNSWAAMTNYKENMCERSGIKGADQQRPHLTSAISIL